MIEKLKITDYGMNGVGIAHSNKTHFLNNVILGEEVEVLNGKTKVIVPSKNRISPICPYYSECGGCNLQHMSDQEQQNYKITYVKNCFNKYKVKFNNEIEYNNLSNLYYRNKISFAVRNERGKNKIGLFQQKTHKIVEIDECLITNKLHKKLLKIFRKYLSFDGVEAFCEETKLGNIRNIVARFCGNNVLVCVVGVKNNLPQKEKLVELLSAEFKEFGLSFCFNKNLKTILNSNIKTIFGKTEFLVQKNGLIVPQNVGSFFQVNDEISEQIYNFVVNETNKQSVVLDAYCGAGTMTAMLAKNSQFALGIECNHFAVLASKELFKSNSIKNAFVIEGKCEDLISESLANNELKIDNKQKICLKNIHDFVCVLDPPRKGCNKKVLDAIIKSKTNKIVYVSCEPITLARDVAILQNDFEIEKICLFDMFYLTSNVETVIVLERK